MPYMEGPLSIYTLCGLPLSLDLRQRQSSCTMNAKLVTKRILSEHTTFKVVLGVEISEAANESRFDT